MPSDLIGSKTEAAARPGIAPPAPLSSRDGAPGRTAAPSNLVSLFEHRRRFYEAWEPADE